ncbi:MAG: hypothetical protein ACKVX9_21730 [Blastocatellia bacterium]
MMHDSPHNLDPANQQSLIDLMLACNSTRAFWDIVISGLKREIQTGFQEDSTLKTRVSNLVSKSLQFSDGIERLLSQIRFHAGSSDAWRELARASFRLLCRISADGENLADRLVDLIEEIEPTQPVIRKICAARAIDPPGRGFASGYDAILVLFQRPGYSQVLEFLQALAKSEGGEQLQVWLDEAAGVFRFSLTSPREDMPGDEHYLMIQIQPAPSDRYRLYIWAKIGEHTQLISSDPDVTYPYHDLVGKIEEAASLMHNWVENQFVLELFVTRDAFCQDFSAWGLRVGKNVNPLVCEAPIALRCLERLDARRMEIKEEKRGLSAIQVRFAVMRESLREKRGGGPSREYVNLAGWRKKNAALRECATGDARDWIVHIAEANYSPSQHQALAGAICVSLGSVPPLTEGGQDALSEAINRGAPVAIWFREMASGGAIDKQTLMQHLRLDQTRVTMADLRRHLWALRKDAVSRAACDEVCHHLTMMYDEYDRIPPEPVSQPPEIQ